MTDIFLTSFGQKVYIGADYDISSATAVRVKFSSSAGTFSATASILAANTTLSCGTIFCAEKAAKYVVASGDFSAHSSAIIASKKQTYDAWLDCTFGTTAKLISTSFKFTVTNPGDA